MESSVVVLLIVYTLAHLMGVDSTVNYRMVTVINQCSQSVRVGRTGGKCMPRNNISYPVTGCPTSMTLNPTDNQCYWDIPSFGNGTDLQPGENISYALSGLEFTCTGLRPASWSGNFWGATGCNEKGTCETGICFYGPNDTRNGYCDTYEGPKGPVTRAEFTLQNNIDTYDVTTIGGANIPMEMKPTGVTPGTNRSAPSSNYWCGNAGGIRARNSNLSDCNWMYDFSSVTGYGDMSVNLTLIAKSTSNMNCMHDSDCPGGEQCGILQELDPFGGPGNRLFLGRCGRPIGVWTSDGICAWSDGFSNQTEFPNTDPFRCMTSTGQGSGTFSSLFRCAMPQYSTSGYSVLTPTCDPMVICGCPLWINSGINAPATSSCQCDNPVWQSSSLPWLEPIKKACPTSYVFPFDDPSSTFQCNDGSTTSTLGYTITFCPEGRQISRVAQEIAPTTDAGGSGMVETYSAGTTAVGLVLGVLTMTLIG